MNGSWTIRFLVVLSLSSMVIGFAFYEQNPSEPFVEPAENIPEGDLAAEEESENMPAPAQTQLAPDDQNPSPPSEGLIGAGAGILTLLFVSSTLFEVIKIAVLMAFITPLVAKKSNRDELNRGRILGFIEGNAGVHFSALRDALQLANGVTAHHLQMLETQEQIISWRDGKLRRYAASHVLPADIEKIAHPLIGTRLAILETLSDAGDLGLSNTEIRRKLELSRQLLSHHMKQLQNNNFVEKAQPKNRAPWRLTSQGLETLSNSTGTI